MDNENSNMLAKAAATISRDKFFRPLRDLCIRRISLSLKFYVDSGITSLHSHLLPKLCEEVFDSYLQQMKLEHHRILEHENVEKLYTALSKSQLVKIASLFVGAGLKLFDTTVLCQLEEKDDIKERTIFFKKLAEGAPKLASFKLQYDGYIRVDYSLLPSNYISFGLMSQLITLKLSSGPLFSNNDLQVVGSSLPLLRRLDIALKDTVTIERGLKHLHQLKKLEYLVLNFSDINDEEAEHQLIEFCLLSMQKLKVVGYEVHNGPDADDSYCHSFSIFEKVKGSVELSLEHLQLYLNFPPANVMLPHVTHLQVYETKALKFCIGRLFPKLEVLHVNDAPFQDVKSLLQHLGRPLTKFYLTNVEGLCDLQEILNLCPQLECLAFDYYSYVKDIDFIDPLLCGMLAKIKIFSLRPHFTDANSYCKAAGLLKLLMTSCPDMEELSLQCNIPQAEVDEVAAGIAAGAYLCTSKIKRLCVNFKPALPQKSMENLIEQVIMHCPKLTSMKAYDACKSKLDPLINMMRRFDRGHIIKLKDMLNSNLTNLYG